MSDRTDIADATDAVPPPARHARFNLPSKLTVAHAAALRESLLPLVSREELSLDGSVVDSVGIAGLQVLAALVKSRASRPTRWSAVNPTLLSAARLSGLATALALPDDSENAA